MLTTCAPAFAADDPLTPADVVAAIHEFIFWEDRVLWEELSFSNADQRMPAVDASALPAKLDLRDLNGKNYVSPVKNQSPWGTCWSFGGIVTTGAGKGNAFRPYDPCTRAQTVTFLWRAAGEPEPTGTATMFSDVPADQYYAKAVAWAVENGITNGTGDGMFSPDAAVTRAQTVTFLFRALSGEAGLENPFADVEAGAYYYDAVLWAVGNGITDGTSATTFSPNEGCLRAQIVTFLYRAYNGK